MNDRVKKFIYFAKEDMVSAKILFKEGIYNQACFHCQQAAEKILKSFVKSKKGLVPRIHNLTELLKICTEFEPGFGAIKEDCRYLERFYIPTRYPEAMVGSTDTGLPGKVDAEKAVQSMEAIYGYVVKISKQHSCTLKER
jgi:HEPN domain-containing protein